MIYIYIYMYIYIRYAYAEGVHLAIDPTDLGLCY